MYQASPQHPLTIDASGGSVGNTRTDGTVRGKAGAGSVLVEAPRIRDSNLVSVILPT
jgi:hypothetical protein